MKRLLLTGLFFFSCLCFSACAASQEKAGTEAALTEEGEAEPQAEEPDLTFRLAKMPDFSTTDMEGNEVTDEIFAQTDLTVVNFWGTYCGPCVSEMPELAKWSEDMPDNVQLIGIMIDVGAEDTEEYSLAEKIIEETGVTYPNLMLTEDFTWLLEYLVGVPTTFFVDSEGNFVIDPILGADVEGCKKAVEEYLDEGE